MPIWALAGPSVRGTLSVNGRLFAASGGSLYELFANGTKSTIGAIANDNKPVSMAAADINPTSGAPQLAIVSAGTLYVVNLITSVMTIPPGPLGIPFQVAYADGFFVLLNTNGVFQFSQPLDATNWPGINGASVSIYADQTIAMNTVHREVFFMSATHGAVYGDAGDSPIPYDVVTGGDFEQGIAAPFTMIPLDNTMFWLGANKDGAGVVWRASGYTPQRISNHAVEFAMQGYPTIKDAIAYGYQDQGHTFYQIYFPSANAGLGATWVYDVATQMWHEKAFLNTNGTFSAHRSQCHAYAFGNHYVGDWATGNVYQQSITYLSDFDNTIKRVRRSPHIANENEWLYHHSLQVDIETGLTPLVPLPGVGTPTVINLVDSASITWAVQILDSGLFQSTNMGNTGSPGNQVFLNDPTLSTTWQLGVNTIGQLTLTQVPMNLTIGTSFPMISETGLTQWSITLQAGTFLLQSTPGPPITRNPQMLVRWSDDAGHTWSNTHVLDLGASGNYKARAIRRRLGRARDRVYELSITDPIPARIVDGFLKATPGYVVTERISDTIRKAA